MQQALQAVLFDYGLTLVGYDYPRSCLLAMLAVVRPWLGPSAPAPEALMAAVLEPLEADIQEVTAGSLEEAPFWPIYERAWLRAGLDPGREVLERILDLEQRCWDRAVRPAPGSLELLARLRRRGLRTGICSNAIFPPRFMRRQLAGSGLAAELDCAVFSSEVGRRKPAPEIYELALAGLGVRAEATLFVGDRPDWDYEAPLRLGMRALLTTEFTGRTPPPGIQAVARLSDLVHWMDGLL